MASGMAVCNFCNFFPEITCRKKKMRIFKMNWKSISEKLLQHRINFLPNSDTDDLFQ